MFNSVSTPRQLGQSQDKASTGSLYRPGEHLLPWIDHQDVEKEISFLEAATATQDGDKAVKALLKKVLANPERKRYVLPPTLNAVQALAQQFPKFAPVIKFVMGEYRVLCKGYGVNGCRKVRKSGGRDSPGADFAFPVT